MFLLPVVMRKLPVVMRKHAIHLRRHAPQTLGRARICTCSACLIRTRSGDGAAWGWLLLSAFRHLLTVNNTIIYSILSTRPPFPNTWMPTEPRLEAHGSSRT